MHTLDPFVQVAVPVLAIVAGLVLLAYHVVLVRDALRQLARFIESTLCDFAGALDGIAASIRCALVSSTRLLTHDGHFPLPLLIVAVTVLVPVVVLIVVVEVRLWAGYFESLFPEDIQVPILGVVSAGVLTAMMPVAAGFLLGWLFEAMLGAFPLPVLGGGLSDRLRLRALDAFGLIVLWLLLAVTVLDAANEVYDGLGESTCALRAAGDVGDAAVTLDPQVVSTGQLAPDAAQAACVANWKADDQARSIRVILGEIALHLSALFAWSVITGVGLAMLLVLWVPVLVLAAIAGATRLCARLVAGVAALVELLIGILHAVGILVVRFLRWVGIPLPATEMVPVATAAPTASLALADHDFSIDGLAPPPMLTR
jgi:hypothetical protein